MGGSNFNAETRRTQRIAKVLSADRIITRQNHGECGLTTISAARQRFVTRSAKALCRLFLFVFIRVHSWFQHFLKLSYRHRSSKNPAAAIFPGHLGPASLSRSMMAQSGSFGVCTALEP